MPVTTKTAKVIHLDAPDIGSLEKEHLCAAIDKGYVSTFGPLVGEFEARFAEFLGMPKAVAIQSGTAALHMALHVLGIKEGDEVVLPATTFVATLHAVMYVKATPVIVDVDPDTWCLCPQAFKAAITSKTKAVIPVHLYGNACDMKAITSIAADKGIYVVEDATESLGTFIDGVPTGAWGDIGCFSFNGNKLMTTGSGGMMVARKSPVLEKVIYLINQANPRTGKEGHQEVGFNYRMPNLNAALGMAQLSRFRDFLAAKKEFHRIYEEQLGNEGLVILQKTSPKVDSCWWFTAGLFQTVTERLKVEEHLKKMNIPTRMIFKPLYQFPYAQDFRLDKGTYAEAIYEKGLCLPSSTLNTRDGIQEVCRSIKEALL